MINLPIKCVEQRTHAAAKQYYKVLFSTARVYARLKYIIIYNIMACKMVILEFYSSTVSEQ